MIAWNDAPLLWNWSDRPLRFRRCKRREMRIICFCGNLHKNKRRQPDKTNAGQVCERKRNIRNYHSVSQRETIKLTSTICPIRESVWVPVRAGIVCVFLYVKNYNHRDWTLHKWWNAWLHWIKAVYFVNFEETEEGKRREKHVQINFVNEAVAAAITNIMLVIKTFPSCVHLFIFF